MKESPQSRDELTGGLSGAGVPGLADRMGGVLPAMAGPQALAGVRRPERLIGVAIQAGSAVGLPLPNLGEREVVSAWRASLGGGPLFVRCMDRQRPPPIGHVQRLARMGQLWLDAPLAHEDDGLEMLVAGAHHLVVWLGPGDEDHLGGLGDSAALACERPEDWARAADLAATHQLPLLVAFEPPGTADGVDVYRLPTRWAGRFEVPRIQAGGHEPAAGPADAGDEDDAA